MLKSRSLLTIHFKPNHFRRKLLQIFDRGEETQATGVMSLSVRSILFPWHPRAYRPQKSSLSVTYVLNQPVTRVLNLYPDGAIEHEGFGLENFLHKRLSDSVRARSAI
jgi:hypothetical protein